MSDLEQIVAKLKKRYGTLNVAGNKSDPVDYISTGNLALDLCLEGGIAFGYAASFEGLSGSGKSLLLQMMLADAQKKFDATGVWLDRENAWVNKRATELGIDTSKVIRVQPGDIPTIKHAEEFLMDILPSLDKDSYKLIAIDSLSSFMKEGDKADMGKNAQNIHNLFRKILPFLNDRTSLHIANQMTYKVGILFGDPLTTTGGEGPKYYTTYRLKLDDRKVITNAKWGGEIVGNWLKATVIKTRLGPNMRSVIFPFYYKEGIPYLGGYARFLASRGYLEPKNKTEFKSFKQSTLKYNEETVNEFKVEEFLEKHPELLFKEFPIYNDGFVPEKGEEDFDEADLEIEGEE